MLNFRYERFERTNCAGSYNDLTMSEVHSKRRKNNKLNCRNFK